MLTAIGELEIVAVDPVDPADLTEADARSAGLADLAALRAFLDMRSDGEVYRIQFGAVRPDPRAALREALPDEAELAEILERLRRLDQRSKAGQWTRSTLEIIARRPAVRAGDLADELGRDRDAFKVDVRKLKKLGLTESLEVGYRLSARGESVLDRARDETGGE